MPQFGEERRDVFLKAAADIKAGQLLKRLRVPRWGVRPARSAKEAHLVALETVNRKSGLWVRYWGAAPVLTSSRTTKTYCFADATKAQVV